jgi:hypothetical protein
MPNLKKVIPLVAVAAILSGCASPFLEENMITRVDPHYMAKPS